MNIGKPWIIRLTAGCYDFCVKTLNRVLLPKASANSEPGISAAQLKEELARNPAKGDLLRGTGGFRKVRMRLPGRGKSGGARVIYYYLSADGVVYLVSLYAKNVQENLTAKQNKRLKELSTIIEMKIQEVKDHG